MTVDGLRKMVTVTDWYKQGTNKAYPINVTLALTAKIKLTRRNAKMNGLR
jgi:hypothetical protein